MSNELGQKLKVAREGQGLSLRQIYERTKIPVGHLESIEAGNYDDLPEPVYVAGFIKRYAECVGLNSHLLLEEYRTIAKDKPNNGTHNGFSSKNQAQPVYVSSEYLGRTKLDNAPPTFKTIYFNAIWIVVIVGLISYMTMTQLNNQTNQQDPSVLALRDTASKYNMSQSTSGTTSSESNNLPGKGETKISLSASQHVWVEVSSISTGRSLFTDYLEQGERRDFQDTDGLRVRAGNGGSLTVDYQGKIETFGEAGKVTERTFTTSQAELADDTNRNDKSTPQSTSTKPANPTKRSKIRSSNTSLSEAQRRFRNLEEIPSRQYIPGESLGNGTRTIDVPYRYSEGRLDSE